MGISFMFAMACAVIGFPSLLGLWIVRMWNGKLDADAEFVHPAGIAVGISVVIAASIAAALSPQVQAEAGPWIQYLGVYAVMVFLIGLAIGWIENRST